MTTTTEPQLHFHPVTNLHPKTLTPDQIKSFNENGFLKPFRIFSPQQALANRRYFDNLLAAVKAANDGRDSYSINGYHTQCAGIHDLVLTPAILNLVEDILGPNFICWGTHFFCKLPREGRAVSWHQDASYWPLSPTKTVTAWLAIDDADLANGCMKVIPGTHRLGHLQWQQSAPSENNVLNQTVVNAEQYGQPVYFELLSGEISLHSDLLVHGSEPNNSDRRRCGLTLRYASTDVRADQGWNTGSILCRGADPTHHWANLPRPLGENMDPKSWHKKPTANAGG